MKRATFGIAALVVALGASFLSCHSPSSKSFSPPERSFEFRYAASVRDVPAGASTMKVWLPLPSSDQYQSISSVRVTCPAPYKIERDPTSGNAMLFVELHKPQQHSFDIDMRFRVTRKEYRKELGESGLAAVRASDQSHDNLSRYLQPDALVPTSGRIKDLAQHITAGKTTPLEKARAIYDYVTATLRYDKSGTGWGRGDALYACDSLHGNCTDFHSLFIGLARAVGIPAKFEIGFPLPENQSLGDIPGYHCWAEFYIDGIGWIPIDSSEASKNKGKRDYFFGALDAHRVQFTQGRDLQLVPPQSGKPLNFFIYPYVEVDGREFPSVEKKFSFSDLK